MPALLEIHPALRPDADATLAFQHLIGLLQRADDIFTTKQRSPATMIGDWQSIETVYAVVDQTLFNHWQQDCFAYFHAYFEDAEALVYGFRELCHFPSFFEFLEGHKFLKSLELAPCFTGLQVHTPYTP